MDIRCFFRMSAPKTPNRSGYRTDGTPHHGGVRNEHVVCEWLSQNPPECMTTHYGTNDLRFEHRGGTHSVTDTAILRGNETIGNISTKNNNGGGTFDHINTPVRDETCPNYSALEAAKDHVKTTHYRNPSAIDIARDELNELFDNTLNTLQDEHIRALLRQVADRYHDIQWMIVSRDGTHHVFRHEKVVEILDYPNDPATTYELRNARDAKTSRQIWRITNGVAVNTHLRIRLTTNNGVKALLGLVKKGTAIVFKVQQDNVQEFLRSVLG